MEGSKKARSFGSFFYAALALFCGLVAFYSYQRKNATKEAPTPPVPRKAQRMACAPGRCKPIPTGMMGLSFGMTFAQVKAVLKASRYSNPKKMPFVPADKTGYLALVKLAGRVRLPGFRITAHTRYFGQDAKCSLGFAIERRLASIKCRFKSSKSLSVSRLKQRIFRHFQQQYGEPKKHEKGFHTIIPSCAVDIWHWKGKKATLRLKLEETDYSRGVPMSTWEDLELTNEWYLYHAQFKAAKKEANRREKLRKQGKKWEKVWQSPIHLPKDSKATDVRPRGLRPPVRLR